MEGVEILATIENSGNGGLGIALLVSVIIGCAVLIVVSITEDFELGVATGILTFALSLIISGAIAIGVCGCDEYTAYKVTISDEVNLKEFLDKYEIISREDEIFLIREVNENE